MTANLMDRPVVAQPPRELVDFAKRQLVNSRLHAAIDRRSVKRDRMVVPVLVQPVDEDFQPMGTPFSAVTRDLSPSGVSLLNFEPILHENLALHMCLANTEVNLVAKMIWCKPTGPFYAVGGKFIAKLEAYPRQDDFTTPSVRPDPQHVSPVALAAEQCARNLKGLKRSCRRANNKHG